MTVFNDMQKMYPNSALILLGISIGATAVLEVTGVFTSCWITNGQNCTGIVPFDSSESAWLAATSWMMFISVGVAVVVIALYFVIVTEKRDYKNETEKRLTNNMAYLDDLQKKYPNLALIILGISIGLTAALDITGVFSNSWICDSTECVGIVPFDSSEPAWLAASSWMLFISVGVMVLMIATYFVLVNKVLKHDYHLNLCKWLITIRILSVLYFLLIVISIIVMKSFLGKYTPSIWLGWSCILTACSALPLCWVQCGLHLVQRQCIAT
ncbi:hypothetical protein CRE_30487 [Caenorhabditis remanei]|uniref:Uncharacterized protein n=1 Tax=Caenorhabditis remanei TaxID=31234 RepID=E3NGJ5_CAERE|nr:hypothetical protein CRE_30487 [Caenorhabditis remanei]